MQKFLDWWEWGVYSALCLSIILLGVGRLELGSWGQSMSAWSVSRTTFFFWLIWKLLLWFWHGRKNLGLAKGSLPISLLTFLAVVTASLLPDFHEAADYRYLFFAVMHCVMVLDLFATDGRAKLLQLLLGLLPALLVVRGIVYDPSVVNFDQMHRLRYPLSHPNPAGLLFAMSIPLALSVIVSYKGWLRGVTIGSLGIQFWGVILTYSRGAWLGCVASLLAVSLVEKSLRRCALTIGFLGLVAFLGIAPLRSRLMTLGNLKEDVSIIGRLKFMTDALVVGLKNPLLGVGYGRDRLRESVKIEMPNSPQVGFIPHSHSMYTEMFAETGLLGVGALMWMVLSNINGLIRRARNEVSPPNRILYFCLSASLIAFLVFGLADVPFYNHDTRIFFFTLMAVSYVFLRSDIASQRSNRIPSS